MPYNKADYPADWASISYGVKKKNDWKCEGCGKQCYYPGVMPLNRRYVLTVHHINHIPMDCRPENLIALCAPCHLRADTAHHARTRRNARTIINQISMEDAQCETLMTY
ncbi:hypothetical protein AGMMS49992_24310 [Clostridia bacterium]|nr:hypothetical protein AGMMS49992_24310 [Clostridia bacterium]